MFWRHKFICVSYKMAERYRWDPAHGYVLDNRGVWHTPMRAAMALGRNTSGYCLGRYEGPVVIRYDCDIYGNCDMDPNGRYATLSECLAAQRKYRKPPPAYLWPPYESRCGNTYCPM